MSGEPDDTRYRSRKWRMACWVEGFATAVAVAVVAKTLLSTGDPMPVLWWWSSVSGGVLTLYGAANVADSFTDRGGDR